MKRNVLIQLKAAFLLMVFALNIVVGFACSVGMDLGFNLKHHQEEEATEAVVHIHKDDKKHIHHEKKESHSHDKPHHQEANKTEKSQSAKENCCNDKVQEFQQLDKSIPTSLNVIHPIFFTAFAAVYYSINILPHIDIARDIKPFVRSYHPPILDIRIAIQSFQI